MNDNDKRHEYAAGLRALADILDANPDVPLPYHGHRTPLTFMCLNGDNPKATLAAVVRAFPGMKNKEGWRGGASGSNYFDLTWSLHGLRLTATAFREQVCERIVTGTREVTREVPDPEALAAVPVVTVTETVEDVDWKCAPLLAAEAVA